MEEGLDFKFSLGCRLADGTTKRLANLIGVVVCSHIFGYAILDRDSEDELQNSGILIPAEDRCRLSETMVDAQFWQSL